jgi:hypothetical protein
MVNIGLDKGNEGKYIFRHEECHAGSDKWIEHFMHKSPLRSLFMNAEGKKMNADAIRSLGEKIVEKTKEKHEKEICDRLDKRKAKEEAIRPKPRVQLGRTEVPKKESESPRVVATGKKGGVNGKKSWRTMSIRRGRG